MAEYDAGQSTTTSMNTQNNSFSVGTKTLDNGSSLRESHYDYTDASEFLGYYKSIPELKKAIDNLATWTIGKGYTTDERTNILLESLRGWGEDSFQSILWNLQVQKKVYGDAFAEIIRKENGRIVNIKPLDTAMMRVVVDEKGMIKRYEQRSNNPNNTPERKFKPSEILHLVNDRIGSEIHGTSVIEACKWVIDARNEAMTTHRKVLQRNLALGILYIDTDKDTKINAVKAKYEAAIKNGEVLVLPKDAAEIKDGKVQIQDPISWITYLESFFYQAVGIPKVMATSEGQNEASSKIGFLTFEPIYTREQTELEADLWAQTAIRIKFNKPPSLQNNVAEDEAKNTGQTGFQESETTASLTRSE